MAYLYGGSVAAQPGSVEAVLVLEAPNEASWKEGVQAIVAELLTRGHELRVRAARAESLERLQQELQQQIEASGASAGVSVTREGDSATALLCLKGFSPCERLRMNISDGELSRSRLAVAVVERLRPLDLPPVPTPPATAPTKVAASTERPIVSPPPPASARPLRAWLGGGVVVPSGTAVPISWLGASLGLMLAPPWGIELGLGGSPLPGRAESYAGSLSLRAFQAAAFLTFEPFSKRSFGFGLGLGGGALHLQASASPTPGFDGFSQRASIGVVSARARLFQRIGPIYWAASIDPGLLVPAVKVAAGTETVLRIGRPWLCLQTTVGIDL